MRRDKLIPSDMPGSRQEICFVLQNFAIRCVKVPFLVKILVGEFQNTSSEHTTYTCKYIHSHTQVRTCLHHFQRTIMKKKLGFEKPLCPLLLLHASPQSGCWFSKWGVAQDLLRVSPALQVELGHPSFELQNKPRRYSLFLFYR